MVHYTAASHVKDYFSVCSLTDWKDIKISGDTQKLANLIFKIFSNRNQEMFQLLNEMFSASNDPFWIEFLQDLIIDIIWTLGSIMIFLLYISYTYINSHKS